MHIKNVSLIEFQEKDFVHIHVQIILIFFDGWENFAFIASEMNVIISNKLVHAICLAICQTA